MYAKKQQKNLWYINIKDKNIPSDNICIVSNSMYRKSENDNSINTIILSNRNIQLLKKKKKENWDIRNTSRPNTYSRLSGKNNVDKLAISTNNIRGGR